MTTIVYDRNIVVALLSQTDALHTAAVRAAQRWEAQAARVAISTVTWAKLRTDKKLIRAVAHLAELVVP